MAKAKRLVVAEFSGQYDSVGSPNMGDEHAEICQNIRLDKNGELVSRQGMCTTKLRITPADCYSVDAVELNGGATIVMHTAGGILFAGIGTDLWVDGGANKYQARRGVDKVPERTVYSHEALIPFDWEVAIGTPSFTSVNVGGVAGNYVDVEATGDPGWYIYGAEMVVDGDYLAEAAYAIDAVDSTGCNFTSVFIPATATNWQFRYVAMDGSKGPLTTSAAIPYP